MTEAPEQCVILIGGTGIRLGALTRNCPKPMLRVGDKPFIERLIWQAKRFGFRRILLLAGYLGETVVDYFASRAFDPSIEIKVTVEPEPKGTAGALQFAAKELEPHFFFLNGDSMFNFNWLDLVLLCADKPSCLVAMALRSEEDTSRYGLVEYDAGWVTGFRERGSQMNGLINCGVYLMSRDIVELLPETGSLERDVLPALAAQGRVCGQVYESFFIDIGTPESFAMAGDLLKSNEKRPAVFLDRDGVLNVDHGYVHQVHNFKWIQGAIKAVKYANDRGYYVFLVTNQAGVAHGFYDEEQVKILHDHVQRTLRSNGAHLDDIRYCPYHIKGTVAYYARASDWRKPEPGMILDLMKHWPIDLAKSFVIGDKPHDMQLAKGVGVRGLLFTGGNLAEFMESALQR